MWTKPGYGSSKKRPKKVWLLILIVLAILMILPVCSFGRIRIDINAPSIQKFRIAIPAFNNLTPGKNQADLAKKLYGVIEGDLEITGYFSLIDRKSFLAGESATLSPNNIRFKDWSVIGAELLLYSAYTCDQKTLEIEMRLFDVFSGRQLMGKRVKGNLDKYRYLIHRLSNEIITALTGQKGISLTKLAFISDQKGRKEIYMCDYDGHNVRQITRRNLISIMPRLSPNGKQIAYTAYKEGSPMLYLQNLMTGKVKRISGRSGINTGVAWLSGSDKVAVTMSRNGNPDIYLINLDGKIIKRLTTYWGIDISPTFSPDGKKLAFVSDRSGSPQIYVLDLETGTRKRLTFMGKYNTSPSWSRLNRIAFASKNNGMLDILTMDPNGGRIRRLTEDQGKNEDPCWSPDGRYIVFSSNRDGAYQLYIMNDKGQNQRKITSFSGNQTAPSWAR